MNSRNYRWKKWFNYNYFDNNNEKKNNSVIVLDKWKIDSDNFLFYACRGNEIEKFINRF